MRFTWVGVKAVLGLLCFAFLSSQCIADESTSIDKLLEFRAENPNGVAQRLPLEPEWIGDIESSDGTTTKLRLEQGRAFNGRVVLYRIWNNRFAGSDAPEYREKLPEPKELENIKSVAELENFFGPSKAFTTGWGHQERMHWTVGWTYFTKVSDKQLRYMSVFGSVSRAKGAERVDVDRLKVSHGLLRQADPNSDVQLKEYPTGEALFVAEQMRKQEQRKKYPLPLRKLLEVDDHPDDSDLVHYRNHLNAIRKNPDPRLFQQLISELDEGTLKMQSHLERILCGMFPGMPDQPGLPRLAPWQPDKRVIAVKACIDAIPEAKSNRSAETLAVLLLRMNGGGTITVSSWDGSGGTRIEVRKNGLTSNGSRENPTRKETQEELRRLLKVD